jgi:hypothetical protein
MSSQALIFTASYANYINLKTRFEPKTFRENPKPSFSIRNGPKKLSDQKIKNLLKSL